ncbi:hypothetical protein MSG28_009790 [Choristoneura fumiferana]|uniref:Uncharacterized protein n=1 Tax=Choristoneura fumiferana TaxID=7141 RepID=A0ACC0JCQ2_CHOFU|nr:hypothetical protein MSG28_009790 [Choristoneura fumiferana]
MAAALSESAPGVVEVRSSPWRRGETTGAAPPRPPHNYCAQTAHTHTPNVGEERVMRAGIVAGRSRAPYTCTLVLPTCCNPVMLAENSFLRAEVTAHTQRQYFTETKKARPDGMPFINSQEIGLSAERVSKHIKLDNADNLHINCRRLSVLWTTRLVQMTAYPYQRFDIDGSAAASEIAVCVCGAHLAANSAPRSARDGHAAPAPPDRAAKKNRTSNSYSERRKARSNIAVDNSNASSAATEESVLRALQVAACARRRALFVTQPASPDK